jgi:hypothetical protein
VVVDSQVLVLVVTIVSLQILAASLKVRWLVAGSLGPVAVELVSCWGERQAS